MAQAKKFKIAPIHEILPQEIFVIVLKKLGYDSISVAQSTCQKWKKVIDDFKLMKVAASKYFFDNQFTNETKTYFHSLFQ